MKNLRKKNGFTLVELLAVIVVLAILMIVAFPAILDVMNDAKKQNMSLFAEKMLKDAQSQYAYDYEWSSDLKGEKKIEYGIDSFKYANVGDYDGCVIVQHTTSGDTTYQVIVVDKDYNVNATMGGTNKADLTAKDNGSQSKTDIIKSCKFPHGSSPSKGKLS